MSRAVLSIGSNMGDRLDLLCSVREHFADRLVAASAVYATPPWGPVAQDDFDNAVLVVEDDPVINQAVSDRLAAEGYDVVRAYDGPGAVAAYGEHGPDVVVLDVMIPGLDGHEVCRRIQAD